MPVRHEEAGAMPWRGSAWGQGHRHRPAGRPLTRTRHRATSRRPRPIAVGQGASTSLQPPPSVPGYPARVLTGRAQCRRSQRVGTYVSRQLTLTQVSRPALKSRHARIVHLTGNCPPSAGQVLKRGRCTAAAKAYRLTGRLPHRSGSVRDRRRARRSVGVTRHRGRALCGTYCTTSSR